MSGFDRVARLYRALEYAAFGGLLQRARTAHLAHVTGARRALLIGDGDGRFLAAFLAAAPHAHVISIDTSTEMLRLAHARVAAADHARVTLRRADIRTCALPDDVDLVVTLFSLDCFTDEDTALIVRRLATQLSPTGQWLFADFAVPERGFARLQARVVVSALYTFFRWRTGIDARVLPSSERHLREAGLVAADAREFRAGLIRSAVYARRS